MVQEELDKLVAGVTPSSYIKDAMRTNSLAGNDPETLVGAINHPTFGVRYVTVGDLMLQDAGWGITGEAGEVADLIKKQYSMNHPTDDDKLAKETGDVLWYVAEICLVKGWTFKQLMAANVKKLAERYGDKFTTEKSLNRAA